MKIVEYDVVDPLQVLQLNLLSLGYALTPERVALIRRLDPRPFPFFAIYAIEEEIVVGQVGVYRLPMVSTEGREDVGGVCAVCTHPAFSRHGIARELLEVAHNRMRAAGLRFSTLRTSRHRVAHALYLRQGYEDVFFSNSTIAHYQSVLHLGRLRAERANAEKLHLTDDLFRRVANGRLGFAYRYESFITTQVEMGEVDASCIWLLRADSELVGYALVDTSQAVLTVNDILLAEPTDTSEAVMSIAREMNVHYVQVCINNPLVAESLRLAGFPPACLDWSTFMIKPLAQNVTIADARCLFGIGTERFLFSWMDTT
jgi:GNAT superfamily N-acetyltransferase